MFENTINKIKLESSYFRYSKENFLNSCNLFEEDIRQINDAFKYKINKVIQVIRL